MKKAVIIYGSPGSGKSTQAELVARMGHHTHFDTGRAIRNLLESPEAKKDPILKRERALNNSGRLCTPSWVLKTVKHAASAIASSGNGVVFSGSPRTMYEAFGDTRTQGLFEFLSKLFGKKNIIVIQLDVHEHVSKKRNAARFTCSLCALPRLAHAQNRLCSFCDAPFKRRDDDAPEVTHARFEEYYTRTLPIVSAAKRAGYTIKKINGEKLPFAVFKSVRKAAGI